MNPLKINAGDGITVREWMIEQDTPSGMVGAVVTCYNGIPESISFFQGWQDGRPTKPPRITLKTSELDFFLAMFKFMKEEHRIMEDGRTEPEVEVTFEGKRSEEAVGQEVPEDDL